MDTVLQMWTDIDLVEPDPIELVPVCEGIRYPAGYPVSLSDINSRIHKIVDSEQFFIKK